MEIFPYIRMEGTDFGVSELAPPWAFRTGAGPVHFLYVVREGSCWLELEEAHEPILLREGDVAAVAGGHPHVLRDSRATPPPRRIRPVPIRTPPSPLGPRPGKTTLFVGRAPSDLDPLTPLFPAVIHLPTEGSTTNRNVHALTEMIEAEAASGGPGANAILARLSEVIVIELLRTAMSRDDQRNPAWTRGLADPIVARTVANLFAEPGRHWNIEEMRRVAGLSRSAFEHRFHALVGESPKRYLVRLRMRLAIAALRQGRESLAQIASRLGYGSEAAFHRAFKRATGSTPGEYRRRAVAERADDLENDPLAAPVTEPRRSTMRERSASVRRTAPRAR
jgi:AraC-like DNA-binding protein